ncbi:MAG: hypothetical protein GY847_40635 [Proteobacteria bacterium]|nr:hypothetical protein [Pseudomonadota bacterium]
MMNQRRKITSFLVLLALVPGTAFADVTIKASREDNSLGSDFQPPKANLEDDDTSNDIWKFNYQDCTESIYFTIEVDHTESISDRKLYIFSTTSGQDCPNSECFGLEATANEVQWSVRFLLDPTNQSSETICSGSGELTLWAALLKSKAEKDPYEDDAVWSEPLELGWDMDPPAPPTNLQATPGDNKMVLNWETEESEEEETQVGDSGTGSSETEGEIAGFYLLHWGGIGSDTDTDADADLDLDAGTDASADIDLDTESIIDAGTDAGADTKQPVWRLYGANGDQGSECPSGGFSAGDAFDPTAGYDTDNISNGDVTDGTISGLTNNTSYKFGVISYDAYRNLSNISNVVCGTPGETCGFECNYGEAGGKAGKFCFVATAAFGSYNHPVVKVLRRFRDEFLEPLPGGKALISAYYSNGPALAAVIGDNVILGSIAQGALAIFAGLTIPLTVLGPTGAAGACALAFFGVVFGLVIARRRRR